jgi:hypothetical protein
MAGEDPQPGSGVCVPHCQGSIPASRHDPAAVRAYGAVGDPAAMADQKAELGS